MKKISSFFLISSFILLVSFGNVLALDLKKSYTDGLKNTSYGKEAKPSMRDVIVKIINFFLGITAALAVLVIIASGILYITSGGDSNKVETAKNWIMYAVVGIIVVLIAYVIVYSISNVFSMTSP